MAFQGFKVPPVPFLGSVSAATPEDFDALNQAHRITHAKARELCEGRESMGNGVDVGGSRWHFDDLRIAHDHVVAKLKEIDPSYAHKSPFPEDCSSMFTIASSHDEMREAAGRTGWCIGPTRKQALIAYGFKLLDGREPDLRARARERGFPLASLEDLLEEADGEIQRTVTEWREADLEAEESCRFPTKADAFAAIDRVIDEIVRYIENQIDSAEETRTVPEPEPKPEPEIPPGEGEYVVKEEDIPGLLSEAQSRYDFAAQERRQQVYFRLIRQGADQQERERVLDDFDRQAAQLRRKIPPFVRGLVGRRFDDWREVTAIVEDFIDSLIDSIETAALAESRSESESVIHTGDHDRDGIHLLRELHRASGDLEEKRRILERLVREQRPETFKLPSPAKFIERYEEASSLMLFRWHRKLHDLEDEIIAAIQNSGRNEAIDDWTLPAVKKGHDLIVRRLKEMEPDYSHRSPIEIPPLIQAIIERDLGDKQNQNQKLNEALRGDELERAVLEGPEKVMLIPGYVQLVGSTVAGEEKGNKGQITVAGSDNDILLRSNVRDHATEMQIRNIIGKANEDDLHFVYSPVGPHGPAVELYHLMLVRTDLVPSEQRPLAADRAERSSSGPFKRAMEAVRRRLRLRGQRELDETTYKDMLYRGERDLERLGRQYGHSGDERVRSYQRAYRERLEQWRDSPRARPFDDPRDLRGAALTLLAELRGDLKRSFIQELRTSVSEGAKTRTEEKAAKVGAKAGAGAGAGGHEDIDEYEHKYSKLRTARVAEGCWWLGPARIDDLIAEFRPKLPDELDEDEKDELIREVRTSLERKNLEENENGECVFGTKDAARAFVQDIVDDYLASKSGSELEPSNGTQLRIAPQRIEFEAVVRDGAVEIPPPQSVSVASESEETLEWAAGGAASWLGISPAHGTTPSQMEVSLIPEEVLELARRIELERPTIVSDINFRVGMAPVPERVTVSLTIVRGVREALLESEFIPPMRAGKTFLQPIRP